MKILSFSSKMAEPVVFYTIGFATFTQKGILSP